MEYALTFDPPATPACASAIPGNVRGSLATHPTHGVALLTCFHGVAFMAQCCPCGTNHQACAQVNGVNLAVNVINVDRDRDVAWLSCPQALAGRANLARAVTANLPAQGEVVTVCSSHGNFAHIIVGLPTRDPNPNSAVELQIQPTQIPAHQTEDTIRTMSFGGGQSGSPVVNLNGVVVGVVRNNQGRCGLIHL
jgi:hypothetical protein